MRRSKGLVGPLLLVSGLAGVGSGCGEEYSDEPFGVLDLASVYDGGTLNDPAAGLPEEIPPANGFLDGELSEYYDFGAVPVTRDPFTGAPRGASVQPMYFFFNAADGAPLVSAPVRESRDGGDWIRGGRQLLNPNPRDFCASVPAEQRANHACHEQNKKERLKPYPTRVRDLLIDPVRRTADYQRPIVDLTPEDISAGAPQYTGMWEIVEVLAPGGYKPDSIKHAATLQKALASGTFKQRQTGKVINCPIIDERTYVVPGVTDRHIPRPRIELWYRRKLAFCYLVHGWETLGNANKEAFFANSDDLRLDTFDVERLAVGQGARQETRLVVPIGRAYTPAIYTSEFPGALPTITRIADALITEGRPRHSPADPPGYMPLRWMWDLRVPSDHRRGSIDTISKVDTAVAVPQRASPTSRTTLIKNLPLRGQYTRCGLGKTTKFSPFTEEFKCGEVVKNPIDGTETVDGSKDPKCNALGLECDPYTCYCDLPYANYGERCGPATAQCKFIQYIEAQDRFAPLGMFCFPGNGGFCHLLCDAREEKNTRAEENQGKKPTEFLDSRCKEVPGYQCLALSSSLGACLKFCDLNIADPKQCTAKVQIEDTVRSIREERDIGEGQTCQDWGLEICTWPENYGQ
jgi:hypothetical protein